MVEIQTRNVIIEDKQATVHQSFATHILENGITIRVYQELPGHAAVKTTETYAHVMRKDIDAIQSPLESLSGV